jgi:hypothetical protein
MDHSQYGTCTLEAAGLVLAQSEEVLATLQATFNASECAAALDLLRSGALVGQFGAEVHDLLVDAIENESRVVWEGVIPGTEFDFPVHVKSFGGVFFVWAMEYDNVGYFRAERDAVGYIRGNWHGVRCT